MKKKGNLQFPAVCHKIDRSFYGISGLTPGGIYFISNVVSKPAKGVIPYLHSGMSGIGKALHRQVVFAGQKQFSFIYRITAQRFLNLFRGKKQSGQLGIHDSFRKTVDPFSHIPSPCIFIV